MAEVRVFRGVTIGACFLADVACRAVRCFVRRCNLRHCRQNEQQACRQQQHTDSKKGVSRKRPTPFLFIRHVHSGRKIT
jgi:hypothetical protein